MKPASILVAETLHGLPFVVAARQDHRQIGPDGFDLRLRFLAAHNGHRQVENDESQFLRMQPNLLDGGFPVGRDHNLITVAAQRGGGRMEYGILVVHKQHEARPAQILCFRFLRVWGRARRAARGNTP